MTYFHKRGLHIGSFFSSNLTIIAMDDQEKEKLSKPWIQGPVATFNTLTFVKLFN